MTLRGITLAGLLLVLPLCACSTGPTSTESRGFAARGESDGFVAAALLTDDFAALIREWQKPESPRLKTVNVAPLGASLHVAFFVAGCRPGPGGKCNVEAEITVTNEAGDVRAKATIADLCPDQQAPPPNVFMLCGRTPAVDNRGTPERLAIGARVRDLETGRSVDVDLAAEFR